MRLDELPIGWRTEFILHRLDARIVEHDDAIAVCTDRNPTYYWGNFLLLPAAPDDAALGHWLARFQACVADGRPEVRHVAIGIAAARDGRRLPAWQAAGFAVDDTAVLALRRDEHLAAPRPVHAARWQVRPIDWAGELAACIDLQCLDAGAYEPAGYRLFRQRQMARMAQLARQGCAEWFGLWCDGPQGPTLAAGCGLMRDAARPGAIGRFQHVGTHPQWRRRGLCSALVRSVSAWGFAQWQLAQAVLCADPHDVAIGIYRALGYRQVDASWQLQRNAPQDRPLPAPAA